MLFHFSVLRSSIRASCVDRDRLVGAIFIETPGPMRSVCAAGKEARVGGFTLGGTKTRWEGPPRSGRSPSLLRWAHLLGVLPGDEGVDDVVLELHLAGERADGVQHLLALALLVLRHLAQLLADALVLGKQLVQLPRLGVRLVLQRGVLVLRRQLAVLDGRDALLLLPLVLPVGRPRGMFSVSVALLVARGE
eukprot:1179590-Prorocentrum_minimum.AAC.4